MASGFATPKSFGSRPTSSGRGKGSEADRGKGSEALLAKELDKLVLQAANAYTRLPDARAGSLSTALADFLYLSGATSYLLEVKETEHEYRLPHGNFDTGQVARMRRFVLAGAVGRVLVHHTTTKLWRIAEVESFRVRDGGSWNLSGFQTETLADIVNRGFTVHPKSQEQSSA